MSTNDGFLTAKEWTAADEAAARPELWERKTWFVRAYDFRRNEWRRYVVHCLDADEACQLVCEFIDDHRIEVHPAVLCNEILTEV